MNPEGYYLNCDVAVCVDCYRPPYGPETLGDWDEPQPITYDDEADCPTHCEDCGALVEHRLTNYGIDYIIEAVIQDIETRTLRPCTRMWVEAYNVSLDDLLNTLPASRVHLPEPGAYAH